MAHPDRPSPLVHREVAIRGDRIVLGALLKWAGLASTGGEAKQLIQDGRVAVNGQTETRRHRYIVPGDIVTLAPLTFLHVVGGGSAP